MQFPHNQMLNQSITLGTVKSDHTLMEGHTMLDILLKDMLL